MGRPNIVHFSCTDGSAVGIQICHDGVALLTQHDNLKLTYEGWEKLVSYVASGRSGNSAEPGTAAARGSTAPKTMRVTVQDLLQHGYLEAGTVLTAETDGTCAIVTEDGQLKLGSETFPFPSTAAKRVVGLGISVNGWEFWRLPNGDQLNVLRKRLRSESSLRRI